MIHLTTEGAAVTLAALLVIAVFMAVRARADRHARILAKYRRGEQDRDVQRMKADILDECNARAAR